jgi:tryptophan synthase alpha chain
MPDRLADTFRALRERDEKAMGLFLTSGFPDPGSTLDVLHAIDRGGADFIELGMPFSDPLAEGKPIQRASERALAHGATLDDAFETVHRFRTESQTPLLMMGYLNPVLRYGPARFCEQAAEAGADGLILPDLPPEEGALVEDHTRAAGLGLVYLIAPNTPDARIREIDHRATGFVYAVSVTGLTGSRLDDGTDDDQPSPVEAYLKRARHLVQENPLLVGFGIQSHEDAMRLSRHTDGFIVGSALIRAVRKWWDERDAPATERLEAVEAFAHHLKYGTSQSAPRKSAPRREQSAPRKDTLHASGPATAAGER